MPKRKIENLKDPALAEMKESTKALFEDREEGKEVAGRLLEEEKEKILAEEEAAEEATRKEFREMAEMTEALHEAKEPLREETPLDTLEPKRKEAVLRWAKIAEKNPELKDMFKAFLYEEVLKAQKRKKEEETRKAERQRKAGTMRALPPKKRGFWDRVSGWLNW